MRSVIGLWITADTSVSEHESIFNLIKTFEEELRLLCTSENIWLYQGSRKSIAISLQFGLVRTLTWLKRSICLVFQFGRSMTMYISLRRQWSVIFGGCAVRLGRFHVSAAIMEENTLVTVNFSRCSIAYLARAGKAVVKILFEPPTLTPETTQCVLRVKLQIEWAIPQQPRPQYHFV